MSQKNGRGRPPGLAAQTETMKIVGTTLTRRTIETLGTRAAFSRRDKEAIENLIKIEQMIFAYTAIVERMMAPAQPAMPVEKKRKRVPGMEGLN